MSAVGQCAGRRTSVGGHRNAPTVPIRSARPYSAVMTVRVPPHRPRRPSSWPAARGRGCARTPTTGPSRWSRSRAPGPRSSAISSPGSPRKASPTSWSPAVTSPTCSRTGSTQAELPLRVTTVVEKEPLGRGGGLKYAAALAAPPGRALVRHQRRHLDPLLAARDGRLPRRARRHRHPRAGPAAHPVGRGGDRRVRPRPGLHRGAAVAVSDQRGCVRLLAGVHRRCCPTAATTSARRSPARPRAAAGRFPAPAGRRTGGPSTPPRTSPRRPRSCAASER